MNIPNPDPSKLTCRGVTIESIGHNGHSKSHRDNPLSHRDFGQSVNIVNLDSQKFFEKKLIEKSNKRPSTVRRKGLWILRSQRSQNSWGGGNTWKCRWRRGW